MRKELNSHRFICYRPFLSKLLFTLFEYDHEKARDMLYRFERKEINQEEFDSKAFGLCSF